MQCRENILVLQYSSEPCALVRGLEKRMITINGPVLSPIPGQSATCRLGDSEAVFQHLKPDNLTFGDGEHDGKVRRDDLAVSLEFRRERTKYHGSVVAGQNVVNLK